MDVPLYGEMRCFLRTLYGRVGAIVGELQVSHWPRRRGVSNPVSAGWSRPAGSPNGQMALVAALWVRWRTRQPSMHARRPARISNSGH